MGAIGRWNSAAADGTRAVATTYDQVLGDLVLVELGATEDVTLADSDYDNLFIVVPAASGPPTVLRLKY